MELAYINKPVARQWPSGHLGLVWAPSSSSSSSTITWSWWCCVYSVLCRSIACGRTANEQDASSFWKSFTESGTKPFTNLSTYRVGAFCYVPCSCLSCEAYGLWLHFPMVEYVVNRVQSKHDMRASGCNYCESGSTGFGFSNFYWFRSVY